MSAVAVAGEGGGRGLELLEWLALRRVRDGGVALVGAVYLDRGRRTPAYLAGPIEELIAAGLVGVGDPDPVTEARTLLQPRWGTWRASQAGSGDREPAPVAGLFGGVG